MAYPVEKDALSQALYEVREHYKQQMPEALRRQFRFSSKDELHQSIAQIQKKQAPEQKLQNLKRLKAFIEAMESFSKVIELFCNVNEFVPFIWGPMKYLLQVASNYVEAFDALLDAYRDISNVLPLLDQYEDLFKKHSHMRIALANIYSDIFTFHFKAFKCLNGKVIHKLFHANWKTFRTNFQPHIDNLNRSRNLVESWASVAHFREFQEFRKQQAMQLKQEQKEEELRRLRSVYQWLGDGNQINEVHHNLCQIRLSSPATGSWLLEKTTYQEWRDVTLRRTPLLWMHGQPGAGKTVLASLVVEDCFRICGGTPNTSTLFFYCSHDTARARYSALAAALVWQAFRKNRLLLNYLYEKSAESAKTLLEDDEVMCRELLPTILLSLDLAYVIIDGLDECSEDQQKSIIRFFTSFVDANQSTCTESLRFLLVSQNDRISNSILSRRPNLTIKSSDNVDDIADYAVFMRDKIEKEFGHLPERDVDLVKQIVANSKGMFLYARLVLDNLIGQESRNKLLSELDDSVFPQGIEQAYNRIITRVSQGRLLNQRAIAFKVLGLLICAKRPLKWREVQGAIAVNTESGEVDFKGNQIRATPKELCGSLIEERPNGNIELVHATARHHLLETELISQENEQWKLADICISLLATPGFSNDTTDREIKALVKVGHYAFLDYAVCNWCYHVEKYLNTLRRGQIAVKEEFLETAENFLDLHYQPSQLKFAADESTRASIQSKLDGWERYSELANAISATRRQRKIDSENEHNAVLAIPHTLQRVRSILETVAQDDPNDVNYVHIIPFYGSSVYKCPRMNCLYFHEGFSNYDRRAEHIKKHEKPFRCSYPGCEYADSGFSTRRELRSHLKESHREFLWDDDEFPPRRKLVLLDDDPEDEYVPEPQKEHTFKKDCDICGRKFTRKINLMGHMNAHRGERPYKCNQCPQAFARFSDCQRHQNLHKPMKHTCQGIFGNDWYGEQMWGCGQEFRRPHKLAGHYIFEEEGSTHPSCIEPLVKQCYHPELGPGRKGKYVCGGEFPNAPKEEDRKWGCGKTFNKPKPLKKHWKHYSGRIVCLKNILRGKEAHPPPNPEVQNDGESREDNQSTAAVMNDTKSDEYPHEQPLTHSESIWLPPISNHDNPVDGAQDFEQSIPDFATLTAGLPTDVDDQLDQVMSEEMDPGADFGFDPYFQPDSESDGWQGLNQFNPG